MDAGQLEEIIGESATVEDRRLKLSLDLATFEKAVEVLGNGGAMKLPQLFGVGVLLENIT
ncbi:hypothetical protein PspLS_05397 [Pyricularia sp. CBS 133598]|nr:hypothetical protein PspLS_05397 [Pyricularia sp. CBS 133598]